MAIKFDKKLEQEVERIVTKFNHAVERANKKAGKEVIQKRSIEGLKNKFLKRSELKRELRLLNDISKKGSTDTVTHGEVEMTKWESDYLKKNLAYAKSQRTRRFKRIDKRDTEAKAGKQGYNSERWYQMMNEREALDRYNLENLTEESYERLHKSINSETRRSLYNKQFYDEFFSRLTEAQDLAHVDPLLMDALKKKLENVDPNAFLEIYNEAPYFKAVMEYIETKGFRKEATGYRGKKSRLAIEEDRFNDIMNDALQDLPRLIRKYG